MPRHAHEYYFLMMGSAYFALGDNDAAIEWLLKSSERNPSISRTYALLAMAYANEKGRDAEARAAAAEVHRLDPNTKLSTFHYDRRAFPAAYNQYFENQAPPAWRKAGLPGNPVREITVRSARANVRY